jgi:hypothetical protein
LPDLLAGTTVNALDTPPTVQDAEVGSYTFTNTTFGVGTTGGTYADCGVAFVACTTGRAKIDWSAQLSNGSAGVGAIVAPVVREGSTVGSGTVVHAASLDEMLQVVGTSADRIGTAILVEGLTAGDTYNVRLEHRVGSASTGTAVRRIVIVAPAT